MHVHTVYFLELDVINIGTHYIHGLSFGIIHRVVVLKNIFLNALK